MIDEKDSNLNRAVKQRLFEFLSWSISGIVLFVFFESQALASDKSFTESTAQASPEASSITDEAISDETGPLNASNDRQATTPGLPVFEISNNKYGPGNPPGYVEFPNEFPAPSYHDYVGPPAVPNWRTAPLMGSSEGVPFDRFLDRIFRDVAPPADEIDDYPRISYFDNNDPASFWYSLRPNLLNVDVPDDWDFYRIIATDRPDFTDNTFTVGKGITYFESGYTFHRTETEDGMTVDNRSIPEVLLRYGATDDLELRFRWNGYVITDQRVSSEEFSQSGYGTEDLQTSFKYVMKYQEDWMPMMTYVGTLYLPSGTNGLSTDKPEYGQSVVAGWGLKRWLYLKAALGTEFRKQTLTSIETDGLGNSYLSESTDNTTEWLPSVSLMYQISKRLGGYIEWYGATRSNGADNRPDHFANTGLSIYLSKDIQLDARIGMRLSSRTDEYYSGMGFSTRW